MSTSPATGSSAPATAARNRAWVRVLTTPPAARLRLLCLHPAGGGPSFFRDWPARLPGDIEVLSVQLPGRESRFGEPLLSDYPRAVEELYTGLLPYLDRPYAMFGHSMGGLLAYGLAMAAQRDGVRTPERLLLSGCSGPGAKPAKPGRTGWSDEELVADLREMGGTPEGVLTDPELLALILPTLRADYAICDSFGRPDGPLLDCPVSVFGGEDDVHSVDALRLWSTTTRAATSVRTFPGGHFYLSEQSADSLLAAVTADLTATA
ncbi:thioesterase II family protein [Kitasatospora sp. HPMI-4]|uniref:thioesterase II family protein n=1 Tax=Kitasatospora sp. HPMI-4 TaxID=3448443 RepID=UPI003F1E399D